MIKTELLESKRIIRHTASETVDREDLVRAIEATSGDFIGILWDFRVAQFDVSLHVVHSPTYQKLHAGFDAAWQNKRTAFVVGSQLHRLMIQTFAEEGEFTFEWEVFFDLEMAEAWLAETA